MLHCRYTRLPPHRYTLHSTTQMLSALSDAALPLHTQPVQRVLGPGMSRARLLAPLREARLHWLGNRH